MPEIEKFVQKLLEAKSEREDRPFSMEELRQIAFEMGLSDEEWHALLADSDAHATTGRGFLNYGNYDDAVGELEQALALNPSRTDTFLDLATAYQRRYKDKGNVEDLEKALANAHRLLDLDPGHDGALRLISDLRKKTGGKRTSPALLIAAGLVVVVIIAVAVGILYLTSAPDADPPMVAESQQKPAETNQPPESSKSWNRGEISEEGKDSKLITDGLDVPVRFMLNDKAKGLDFEVESSVFENYQKSWSYTLKATMPVTGYEFDGVKMKVELIDDAGNVIVTDGEDAWEDYMPALRPGDVIPMDYLEYDDSGSIPKLSEIRVSVDSVQRRPKAASYPEAEPVQFEWPNKPAGFDIEIRRRSMNIGTGAIIDTDKLRHELVLEVKNTGQSVIRLLKLRLDYFDKKEKKRFTKDKLVTIDSYPHIRPGRARVELFLAIIPNMSPDEYGWYDITVVEAK